MGRLLRNLSGYLREDLRTRSEMESRQAWTINGARLAVAAPWLVLLLMSGQTEVIRRYASTAGALVLGFGAVLLGLPSWVALLPLRCALLLRPPPLRLRWLVAPTVDDGLRVLSLGFIVKEPAVFLKYCLEKLKEILSHAEISGMWDPRNRCIRLGLAINLNLAEIRGMGDP